MHFQLGRGTGALQQCLPGTNTAKQHASSVQALVEVPSCSQLSKHSLHSYTKHTSTHFADSR